MLPLAQYFILRVTTIPSARTHTQSSHLSVHHTISPKTEKTKVVPAGQTTPGK
jgi:hypothetical protein